MTKIKILALLLAALLLVPVLSGCQNGFDDGNNWEGNDCGGDYLGPSATSGTCGENLTWALDEKEGVLTISGTGPMADYINSSTYSDFKDAVYSVRTVIIEEGVTSISEKAFAASFIMEITIPDSVTSIGYQAFANCRALTGITLPDSITSIAAEAFVGSGLTSITIPRGMTEVGSWAFQGCTSLTKVTISDSVTSINDFAFEGCTALTEITFPNSVTSIGLRAFENCENLTSITLPDNMEIIGPRAFENCKKLTSITLPNNVEIIDVRAFKDCDNLTTVNFIGTQAEWEALCEKNAQNMPQDVTVNFIPEAQNSTMS